jgi:hypothetical protein
MVRRGLRRLVRRLLAHLRRYAAPPLADELDGPVRIVDDGYDWTLNDASRPS